MREVIKHQIPSTNNQIMTKIPIAKIPEKSKITWSLELDDWISFVNLDLVIGI
jgi:hypothetical protein